MWLVGVAAIVTSVSSSDIVARSMAAAFMANVAPKL